MSGGGLRATIPNSVRKTIQDLKEITGNHSEEEIHAMLKECNMDPNETAQKLLLQDPFHEVKRKRDKRKENLNIKESVESRWRPGGQGRGSRGGRANFSPRHMSHDAGGGRNSGPATENGPSQGAEKGVSPSFPPSRETKNKERSVDGPTNVAFGSTSVVHPSHLSAGSGPEISLSLVGDNLGSSVPPVDAKKTPNIKYGNEDLNEQPALSSSSSSVLPTPASTLADCFSSSDPVLVPSNDSRLPGSLGTIKCEVGSHHPAASEVGSSPAQGKVASKTQGVGKSQHSELSQPSCASTYGVSGSRPSSNYNSRSQQLIGTQKAVGTNKEWKPKPINSAVVQGLGTAGAAPASEVSADSVEAPSQSQLVSRVLDSEEATSKLQRKLEELHLPQRKVVILPNHIHVPESERTKLSFGSFGAMFGVSTGYVGAPESDKNSTPRSETSQVVEESVEEQSSSNQNALATADEGDYPDHPQSPPQVSENISSGGEGEVSSSAAPGHNESKHDTVLPSGGHQFSVAHTSPNYSFGFVPPIIGSQLAPFENSESQSRDVSRLPGFVVQQPFDPASYYAQYYRSGADSDGRVSPFPSPGVSTKYNGNVAVLPQSSQSPQEGGVLSATGPTPLVTQAPGLVQSTQQPLPVFRPPAGMHISHYPPNYIPYSHYFSPFYVPPPAIHQFLGNGAFPQQPQAGGVYPATPVAAAAAAGVKYSLPQYKTGTNTGNSAHMGMASGYGPSGSSPPGYNQNAPTSAGNSTSNEDLASSQFKENNVYITGQQSEGSSVWVAAPGRDISSLTSSFYNLPPQGQHVTFTPTQAAHGTFAGLYHPAQAVTAAAVHPLLQQSQAMAGAVDMVGPGGNVYQQPQHAQMNWPSNY